MWPLRRGLLLQRKTDAKNEKKQRCVALYFVGFAWDLKMEFEIALALAFGALGMGYWDTGIPEG
jgi:hypothetical protein